MKDGPAQHLAQPPRRSMRRGLDRTGAPPRSRSTADYEGADRGWTRRPWMKTLTRESGTRRWNKRCRRDEACRTVDRGRQGVSQHIAAACSGVLDAVGLRSYVSEPKAEGNRSAGEETGRGEESGSQILAEVGGRHPK